MLLGDSSSGSSSCASGKSCQAAQLSMIAPSSDSASGLRRRPSIRRACGRLRSVAVPLLPWTCKECNHHIHRLTKGRKASDRQLERALRQAACAPHPVARRAPGHAALRKQGNNIEGACILSSLRDARKKSIRDVTQITSTC